LSLSGTWSSTAGPARSSGGALSSQLAQLLVRRRCISASITLPSRIAPERSSSVPVQIDRGKATCRLSRHACLHAPAGPLRIFAHHIAQTPCIAAHFDGNVHPRSGHWIIVNSQPKGRAPYAALSL
jgi:hypothetical protein